MSSNGQPPFPPSANFPPFQPSLPPTTSKFPPFPPPQGFTKPPFPPHYPPGISPAANVTGFSASGVRPPPLGYPPRPVHPGLGLSSLPSTLPQPPHQQGSALPGNPPAFRRDVKTTKVFIGSIAPGIGDNTLRELLNACGPLHELKRVEGANGKPQAFGFASFESPEVVLRSIRCLNGVELPDLSVEGRNQRKPPKPLVVKADQKTAEFLQEFEETLGRSASDESIDAMCRKSISQIISNLTDPSAQQSGNLSRAGGLSPIQVIVPAHLQDLKEGDLPEAQRVAVLDQIAIFRENAARREREKKNIDEEKDRGKAVQSQSSRVSGNSHSEYGYGNRAFAKSTLPEALRSEGTPQSSVSIRPGNERRDPQGYLEPVSFVRPESAEGKGETERTDEEEETVRRQRVERDRASTLRDRELRVEGRERQRVDTALREESIRLQRADAQSKGKMATHEILTGWNDDEVEERGDHPFYVDRIQWRQNRHQQRLREQQDDAEDRRQEFAKQKALEEESEDFMQKRIVEMASNEERQRQAGLLTEDAAPVKLALAPHVLPEIRDDNKPSVPQQKLRTVLALSDDEDDDLGQKKKRTLVKLEYERGVDGAEEIAKRNARLLDIVKQLPVGRSRVFSGDVDWAAVHESKTKSKLQAFIQRKISDVIGELDEDLVDFVLEHIADRKGPYELVDGLLPVLAEDAENFALQLWRQLIFEGRAFAKSLDTGSMLV